METTPVDWKNTVSLHEAFWNWKLAASSVPWAKRTPNKIRLKDCTKATTGETKETEPIENAL